MRLSFTPRQSTFRCCGSQGLTLDLEKGQSLADCHRSTSSRISKNQPSETAQSFGSGLLILSEQPQIHTDSTQTYVEGEPSSFFARFLVIYPHTNLGENWCGGILSSFINF